MKKFKTILLFSVFILALFGFVEKQFTEQAKMRVVFINPTNESNIFWNKILQGMDAAAKELNISFETLNANGNHLKIIELTQSLTQRAVKPNYIIISNYKSVAQQVLAIAQKAGIKVFMIVDGIPEKENLTDGLQKKYPNWLGSVLPDYVTCSQQLTANLINKVNQIQRKKVEIAAIMDNRATQSSMEIEEGMMKAARNSGGVAIVNQCFFAEGDEKEAFNRTDGLLSRYPNTNVIITSDYKMAKGILDAIAKRGKIAGRDILVGCFNFSEGNLKYVQEGKIELVAGGSSLSGGWSLAILYDHYNGINLLSSDNQLSFKMVFANKNNAESIQSKFDNNEILKMNFKKYSKKLNSQGQSYNFSVGE